jgi:hypothetical protein
MNTGMGRRYFFEQRLLFTGKKNQQTQRKSDEAPLIHEGIFTEIEHFVAIYFN